MSRQWVQFVGSGVTLESRTRVCTLFQHLREILQCIDGKSGYLECCIDGITSTKHVTYTRFHFSDYGARPFGDHVVWVEIGRDEQETLDLDLLDMLLSKSGFKFEHLERLDLNFAQPDPTSSPRTIASQLSHVVKMNHPTEIQIYANGTPCHRRQIPTELSMSVAHMEGTVCCHCTQNYIGTRLHCLYVKLPH